MILRARDRVRVRLRVSGIRAMIWVVHAQLHSTVSVSERRPRAAPRARVPDAGGRVRVASPRLRATTQVRSAHKHICARRPWLNWFQRRSMRRSELSEICVLYVALAVCGVGAVAVVESTVLGMSQARAAIATLLIRMPGGDPLALAPYVYAAGWR